MKESILLLAFLLLVSCKQEDGDGYKNTSGSERPNNNQPKLVLPEIIQPNITPPNISPPKLDQPKLDQ